jgi:hypothetical protein
VTTTGIGCCAAWKKGDSMNEPIFKLPPVGWVGRRRVDAQYMMEIEARAKRMEEACNPGKQQKKQQKTKDEARQLQLPGIKAGHCSVSSSLKN